ncbi:MAG: Gfo/Idh/MocA family oxidoreductase [Thermoguttaceae bacterium]|nr:Gfo/Idh/MocA family oxidoreductase [Thermoguttaceae bacterium]
MKYNRRNFLKTAVSLGLASVMPSYTVHAQNGKPPVSERIRTACVGLGPQGNGNAHGFNGISDIAALCDVDTIYGLQRALNGKIGRREGDKYFQPDTYKDYRRILERDDIDMVSIGTPDHWHTKIAVEAMQAGKHVFCEKPLTLTLEENELIRKACAKYGKVFQVGTMQRAMKNQFATAALMVRKGILGKIQRVTCITDGGRESPVIAPAPVPESLDWEMWQGQAPAQEFLAGGGPNRFDPLGIAPQYSRHHLTFRWWFEYSGGKITDWGAHHVDCALWILDRQTPDKMPISYHLEEAVFNVDYRGGMPVQNNIYNTPVRFRVSMKFADGPDLIVTSHAKDGNGILIEGTKGRIHVNRARIAGKPYESGEWKDLITEDDYTALYHGKPFEGHKSNFLRCIREGGKPVSNAVENTYSMEICHLCNLACRLNRDIQWDTRTGRIVGDELAASFFSREQRKGYELPKVD